MAHILSKTRDPGIHKVDLGIGLVILLAVGLLLARCAPQPEPAFAEPTPAELDRMSEPLTVDGRTHA